MPPRIRWTHAAYRDAPTTGVTDTTTPPLPSRSGAALMVLGGPMAGHLETLPVHGGILGRGKTADVSIEDSSVSRRHARIGHGAAGFFLEDLGSANGTYVDDELVEGIVELPATCRIQLGNHTVLQFTEVDDEGLQAHRQLQRSLRIDPLTGVGKRSQMEHRLHEEVAYARRHDRAASAMLIDVDHFKEVNDTHGHPAGDAVLVAFAGLLEDIVRIEDSVFRYGGDEFCVLVRGETEIGLELMARRIGAAVRNLQIPHGDAVLGVTVSLGVGSVSYGEEGSMATLDDSVDAVVEPDHLRLLDIADRALLQAKREGRDRVCILRREEIG